VVCEQDLQVADAILLLDTAAGIGMKHLAPVFVHADIVACLVKRGVQGGVPTDIEPVANEAGFALTPETSGDRHCVTDTLETKAINSQQLFEGIEIAVATRYLWLRFFHHNLVECVNSQRS
jgi:hypothetical protein